MKTRADLFEVDPETPEFLRAKALVREDRRFLRSLVQMRKEQQLSQDDVAERLGITQPTVASFERYDSDPKLSTIRRYAQAVGLLICHRVELDRGQAGHGTWPPAGWSEGRVETFTPGFTIVSRGSDSNSADFGLAA